MGAGSDRMVGMHTLTPLERVSTGSVLRSRKSDSLPI
jgi:hypothetical protein